MRRWNGWGDDRVVYPLHPGAAAFLRARLGEGRPTPDARLDDLLAGVPTTRLPEHPLVITDALLRVTHARGQSLPDWIALRGGTVDSFPDGVALPTSDEQVRDLLAYAQAVGAVVIPYGGGTSVVGHITPRAGDPPTLTISMARINDLRRFDGHGGLATFGAGVRGPDLEAQLRARGFTLGHFPQSFEYSTLGGWVAARSSGQQSLYYGRIERLFSGGTIETPRGTLALPDFPASAAGPDLREWVLGSEGRMGILTSATVRITPLPERETFRGIMFPDFTRGIDAVRTLAGARLPLSMLRLSTANETTTTLKLAGHERLLNALERYLAWRGAADERALLLVGITGGRRMVGAALAGVREIAHQHSGIGLGAVFGDQWRKSRFRTPYLRNTLWELGYAIDTFETAVGWGDVQALLSSIERALHMTAAELGTRLHVFTHLSHVYPYGSSIYTTCVFPLGISPNATLAIWTRLKAAVSAAIVAGRGTISHQHGVGIDHAPYLAAEKGALGLDALRGMLRQFDPDGIMNPGKLIGAEEYPSEFTPNAD